MSVRINFNAASAQTHTALIKNERAMNKSLLRLSTGRRILNAADDSAGLFISDQLATVAASLDQGNRNIHTGISALQIAEAAAGQIYAKLQEIYVRAQSAANDINDPNARNALQQEINNFIDAIYKIASDTEYNGIKLLDGSFQNKYIHYGPRMNQTVRISIENITSLNLGNYRYIGSGTSPSGAGALNATNLANTPYYIDSGDYFTVYGQTIIGSSDAGKLLDASVIASRINASPDLRIPGIYASSTNISTAATYNDPFKGLIEKNLPFSGSATSGTGGISSLIGAFKGNDSGDTFRINGQNVTVSNSYGLVDAYTIAQSASSLSGVIIDSVANSSTAETDWSNTSFITASDNSILQSATLELRFYVGDSTFSLTYSDTNSNGLSDELPSSVSALADTISSSASSAGAPLSATYSGNQLVLTSSNGETIAVEAIFTDNANIPNGQSVTIDLGMILEGVNAVSYTGDGNAASFTAHAIKVGNLSLTLSGTESVSYSSNGIGSLISDTSETFDDNNVKIDLYFYVGDSLTPAFSLTGLDNDITLTDLISAINNKLDELALSGTDLPITVQDDGGKLKIITDNGETIGIEAYISNTGADHINGVYIDFSQLIEEASSQTANGSSNWRAYALKIGSLEIVGQEDLSIEENGLEIINEIVAGLNNLRQINVTTQEGAERAISAITEAMRKVDLIRAQIGAIMNNLQAIYDAQKFAYDNTKEAESVIRNTDYAKEMSEFTSYQIRMQATIAMLAQANTLPQLVLQLMR